VRPGGFLIFPWGIFCGAVGGRVGVTVGSKKTPAIARASRVKVFHQIGINQIVYISIRPGLVSVWTPVVCPARIGLVATSLNELRR